MYAAYSHYLIALPLMLAWWHSMFLWSRCLKAGLGSAHCRQPAPGRDRGRESGAWDSPGATRAVATRHQRRSGGDWWHWGRWHQAWWYTGLWLVTDAHERPLIGQVTSDAGGGEVTLAVVTRGRVGVRGWPQMVTTSSQHSPGLSLADDTQSWPLIGRWLTRWHHGTHHQ